MASTQNAKGHFELEVARARQEAGDEVPISFEPPRVLSATMIPERTFLVEKSRVPCDGAPNKQPQWSDSTVQTAHRCGFCGETFEISVTDRHWQNDRGLCPRRPQLPSPFVGSKP